MVFFKAQKLQRLAELLQRVQVAIEREGGETGRVEEGLDEVARRVGVDLDVVRAADAPTLELVLSSGGTPDPGKCWAVAELLYLDGIAAMRRGTESVAADRLGKARRLYALVGEGLSLPDGAPPPAERATRIRELLRDPGPEGDE